MRNPWPKPWRDHAPGTDTSIGPDNRPCPDGCEIHPGEMLVQAARKGHPDKVLQAGCRIALADSQLVGMCAEQIVKAILQCHPQAFPALAYVLREIASRRGGASGTLTTIMLFRMPRDAAAFKVMSVMAAAGFDLRGCNYTPADVPDLRDHHQFLATAPQKTTDDLCTLLAQSPLAPFHGRRYSRFPGDLALWRPFIHGRYGVPWALPAVVAVVGLAMAAIGMVGQGILG
jgi:hypothetical protein